MVSSIGQHRCVSAGVGVWVGAGGGGHCVGCWGKGRWEGGEWLA